MLASYTILWNILYINYICPLFDIELNDYRVRSGEVSYFMKTIWEQWIKCYYLEYEYNYSKETLLYESKCFKSTVIDSLTNFHVTISAKSENDDLRAY